MSHLVLNLAKWWVGGVRLDWPWLEYEVSHGKYCSCHEHGLVIGVRQSGCVGEEGSQNHELCGVI